MRNEAPAQFLFIHQYALLGEVPGDVPNDVDGSAYISNINRAIFAVSGSGCLNIGAGRQEGGFIWAW